MHEQPAILQFHRDRLLQVPCSPVHTCKKLTQAALPGLPFIIGDTCVAVGERRGGDAILRIPVFRFAARLWTDPPENRRQQSPAG